MTDLRQNLIVILIVLMFLIFGYSFLEKAIKGSVRGTANQIRTARSR